MANELKGSLEEQKTALSGLKQKMTAALDALKGQTGKAASTAAAAMAAITALKKNPPKPVIAPPPAGVAFAALRGEDVPVLYDLPRERVWDGTVEEPEG